MPQSATCCQKRILSHLPKYRFFSLYNVFSAFCTYSHIKGQTFVLRDGEKTESERERDAQEIKLRKMQVFPVSHSLNSYQRE
jgi:hypothetical protein